MTGPVRAFPGVLAMSRDHAQAATQGHTGADVGIVRIPEEAQS